MNITYSKLEFINAGLIDIDKSYNQLQCDAVSCLRKNTSCFHIFKNRTERYYSHVVLQQYTDSIFLVIQRVDASSQF